MFFWRSAYRDLERAERARMEGFARAGRMRRRSLFTRALRWGALAFLAYRGLRTEPGRRLLESARARFPAPFDWYDARVTDIIRRLASESVEYAAQHPHLQREREILSAALGIQSVPHRLAESMRAYYVRRQIPFAMTERRPMQALMSILGLQSEQEALDVIARISESGVLDELFATRTRRRMVIGTDHFWSDPTSLHEALLSSRAMHGFRTRLQELLGTDEATLNQVLGQVIAPAIEESVRHAVAYARMNTAGVMDPLRREYLEAVRSGRLENNPLAQALMRRGYQSVSLYEALGFGYTVNDPMLARAFQYVRPEHYRYLDIGLADEDLPSEVVIAIHQYINSANDPQLDDPERLRAFHEAIDRDPLLSLGRFMALRMRHIRSIAYRAYTLAGVTDRRQVRFHSDQDRYDENRADPGDIRFADVSLEPEIVSELRRMHTVSMLVDPETGRVVDLTYMRASADYLSQRFSLFGIPLAPGMFSVQVMRMMPWFRPADDWFIHIDPTARQPIVSEALGRSRADSVGADVFILGGKMFRVDPTLWDPVRNQTEAERPPAPGMVNAPSNFGGVMAQIAEVPGEWTAMRVRGMTMRGMMESLIESAEQPPPRDRWWQRWLHLGEQRDMSWWEKFARSLRYDPDDLTDPRAVWNRFVEEARRRGDVDQHLAEAISDLMSRVMYSADFDELRFIRALADTLEQRLGNLQSPDQPHDSTIDEWYQLFRVLGRANSLEEAMAIFVHSDQLSDFRAALMAAAEPGAVSEEVLARALRFGLLQESALLGTSLSGYTSSVQSEMLMNLLQMRSGLFRYIAEYYTPDRPEHLIDPVPGVLFGLPESKLRFAELLRAMVLESAMQYLHRRGDADEVLGAFLDAAQQAGDPRISAWMMAGLIGEYAGHQQARRDLLHYIFTDGIAPPFVRDAFDQLHQYVRRITSFPYVVEPLDWDEDPSLRANLFILRRGPRFGSWEWIRGYFTRWGRVEDESDLYRYFIGWRLNEMLQPYGLGVSRYEAGSAASIFRELLLYRALPAAGAYMTWRYLNTEMRHLFGYAPADLTADVARIAQMGITGAMDVTGITRLKKWLVSEIPGLDVYFHPRSADELDFYYRYGLSTIRYGRGWISGSRSAFAGEGVYANLPPWYRGIRSYWQAAPNADIATLEAYSRGDVPLPTPRNPFAPLIYPFRRLTGIADRAWSERHRYDRPYPGAYAGEESVWSPAGAGAVGSVASESAPAGRLLLRSGEEIHPSERIDYRRFMLGAGMSPRLREELVTPPGAEESGGRLAVPVRAGHPLVEGVRFTVREAFHRAAEIQGLYGWFQRVLVDSLMARETPVVTDSPGWAYSAQRRFWESLYGGMDVLPWQNELNELLRRFVMKRRPTEYVYYNPVPNNMPYWLPERFRYGDPYIRLHAGELRLPGAAYRWANPARFGVDRPGPHDIRQTDLLTLPAEYIGADWQTQFAALSGLHRSVSEERELSASVLRRVRERYLQQRGVVGDVQTDLLTVDRDLGVRAHTMMVLGTGRDAMLVHAVSASVPREQAELSVMERMRQLGVRRAEMLVVTDPQLGEYTAVPVRYDERRLRRHHQRWRRLREVLYREVESNRLNEGLFYSPLQRLEVLSDVAPRSPEVRRLRRWLSEHEHLLTREEQQRYRYALEVAERTSERYRLYPYHNIQLESRVGHVIELDESGRLHVTGLDRPVRLAGIRLHLSEVKKRYGLPRTAAAEEALARLAEEFGLQTGAEVRLDYSEPPTARGAIGAIVYARGREVNRRLVRLGLAVRDEEDTSRAARRMRQGRLRRLWNWIRDTVTHANTMFHTKFLRVRSPLEEWERGHVFGTRSGSWESPVRSYVIPTITSIANRGVLAAALSGAGFGALFGYTRRAKIDAAIIGAAAGAGLSLVRQIFFRKGYIPARTRRRWEIDEYIDALQYVKYMRLYEQEKRLAREREGVDVDELVELLGDDRVQRLESRVTELTQRIERLRRKLEGREDKNLQMELDRLTAQLQEANEQLERIRREKRRRRSLRERIASAYERLVRRGARRELSSIPTRIEQMGEHTRRALLYRAMAEHTAVGTGVARTPGEALRSVRPYVKEIYRRILEEGTPREKRRFYDLLPDYQKVLLHDLLAPDSPIPRAPDPTRLFKKYGLPGPSWRGWDPDVDLELLRAHLIERSGMDAIDAGVYPTETAVSSFIFDRVGAPVPISSTEEVSARLASLLGSGSWQAVAGATATSKVGGQYYVYVDYYDREYERNVYRHYIRSLSGVVG